MNGHTWMRLAGGLTGGLGAAAVLAVGLATSVPRVATAQEPGQTRERMEGRRGPGGPMGRGGRMGGGPMAEGGLRDVMRDLTDQQREQVRAIHQKHAERVQPLAQRAAAARQALQDAASAGDTGSLQTLAIEVGNAETEFALARAQVQVEIFAILTPEQKQKIAERRKQMEERRGEMMKRRQQRQGQ